MSKHRTYVWHIAWRNPYTPRPADMPEVFLEVRRIDTSGYPTPPQIDEAWDEMRHYGYGVRCFVADDQPRRAWPLERKQKMRRRNLWHRLMKRYPLFAPDWYAERLAAKPDHYGVPVVGEFDGLRIRSQQEHVMTSVLKGACYACGYATSQPKDRDHAPA